MTVRGRYKRRDKREALKTTNIFRYHQQHQKMMMELMDKRGSRGCSKKRGERSSSRRRGISSKFPLELTAVSS